MNVWRLPLWMVGVVPTMGVLLVLLLVCIGHMQPVMSQPVPSGSIVASDWSTRNGAIIADGVLTYDFTGFATYQTTFAMPSAPSYIRWSGTVTASPDHNGWLLVQTDEFEGNGLYVFLTPSLKLAIIVAAQGDTVLDLTTSSIGVTLHIPTTLTFAFVSPTQLTVTTSDTSQATTTQTFTLAESVIAYTVAGLTVGDSQAVSFAGTVNQVTIAAGSPSAAGTGDPVFHGFQGQVFQVHGYPGSYFNLWSSAHLQINARFTFLASGTCGYNFTQCWTHPGTYMDHIGLLWNDGQRSVRVELMAGSHEKGMFVKVNDEAVWAPVTASVGGGNVNVSDTTKSSTAAVRDQGGFFHLSYPTSRSFRVLVPDLLEVTFLNSDMFFNVEATILNSHLLQLGARHTDLTNIADVQQQQTVISRNYGAATSSQHIHGFIGQTWRNIVYPHKHLYEGLVDDYVVSHVLAYDSTFNYYTPAASASIGSSGSAE